MPPPWDADHFAREQAAQHHRDLIAELARLRETVERLAEALKEKD